MDVVIIGNGFDLAHGLRTRYSDFIFYYLKLKFNESKVSEISDSPILNVRNVERFNYDNIDWIKEAKTFTDIQNLGGQHGLIISSPSNFFQSLLVDVLNKNWVDVEYEYYYQLQTLAKKRLGNKGALQRLSSTLNMEFQSFKDAFYDYLEDINTDVRKSKYSFEESPYTSIFNKHCKGAARGGLILNFNYTDLIHKYKENGLLDDYEILNIHGNINDRSSLIFGYGDDVGDSYKMMEDANENQLFEHFKTFKYLMSSNYKAFSRYISKHHPFSVAILGHSMGVSDRTMFNQVFNSGQRQSVKIYHFDYNKTGVDYQNKIYEISRHWKNKHQMNVLVGAYEEEDVMPQIDILK